MSLFTHMDTPTSTLVAQYCNGQVQVPAVWMGSQAELDDAIALKVQDCAEWVKEKKGLAGRKLALGLCHDCISEKYEPLRQEEMEQSQTQQAAFLAKETIPIHYLLIGFAIVALLLYLFLS